MHRLSQRRMLIGSVFGNLVTLIQYLLRRVYGPLLSLKEFLRAQALLPLLQRFLKAPPRNANMPLGGYLLMIALHATGSRLHRVNQLPRAQERRGEENRVPPLFFHEIT